MTETHHKNPNKGNLHRISCTGQGAQQFLQRSWQGDRAHDLLLFTQAGSRSYHGISSRCSSNGRFHHIFWECASRPHLAPVRPSSSFLARFGWLLVKTLKLSNPSVFGFFLFNPNFGRFKMVRPPVVLPLCGWLTESYPCRLRFAWFNPRFAKEQGLT